MKNYKFIAILLFVSVCVAGCNSNINMNFEGYNFVADCQITKTYYSEMPNIAKGESGYYILIGKYLYFFDTELKSATPLCIKPNCTHNNDGCSAAIGVVDTIAYNNEKIYYIESAGEEKEFEGAYITALSADGSKKEHLYYFKETCVDWIVHRGYFYFSVFEYDNSNTAEMGQEINRDAYIYRISLDKSTDEREVVYYAKHVSADSLIDELMAFGDYLYFIVTGNTKENNEFVFESYKQDLKDFSLERLCIENGIELMTPSLIDDKLIFASSKEKDGEYQYYITDFSGNNPEPFCWVHEDDKFISDGKYIYIGKDVYYMEDDNQRIMTVYDAEMNKIDNVDLGSGSVTTWRFFPVDEKFFLFGGKQDSGKHVIFYYDKSEIGTINGKNWDYQLAYKTNENENKNDNKTGALSDTTPHGSDALVFLWRKAKDKEYGVKDSFQSDGADVESGFSVRLMWKHDGGTFTAYFPFMEFENEDKAKEYINTKSFVLQKGNVVVNIGVESVPQEVYDMLSSILDGTPIEPIDSKDFSGENFVFE